MKKNIYIVGRTAKQSSLGIYADALIKELKSYDSFYIIEKRREINPHENIIIQMVKYVWYGISLYFMGREKNDIVLYTHGITFIPPFFSKDNRVIVVHDFFFYDKDLFANKNIFLKHIMYYYYNIIHKAIYKYIFRKSKAVIAISNATKDEIIKKFGSSFSDKIKVIYSGIDTSAFKPLMKREQQSKDNQYLLYVGSELGRKNLKNIIAAFSLVHKEFPNLKLMKAPIESVMEYRNITLKAIKENHLEAGKEVILLDEYLPLEKLVALYQNAEIFLFPTLKEGFGFPIIEAQACGVPVITTHYEPMSELVPYKDMTVDPLNPFDIAEKIIRVLKDKQLRESMIKDGLQYAQQFSRKNTGRQFQKVIDAL